MNWLIYYLVFGAVLIWPNIKAEETEDDPMWMTLLGFTFAWLLWPIQLWHNLRKLK